MSEHYTHTDAHERTGRDETSDHQLCEIVTEWYQGMSIEEAEKQKCPNDAVAKFRYETANGVEDVAWLCERHRRVYESGIVDVVELAENRPKTGLYNKYSVFEGGERVTNCFVLEPESDSAARRALEAYADATDDPQLASDINDWIRSLDPESDGGDA